MVGFEYWRALYWWIFGKKFLNGSFLVSVNKNNDTKGSDDKEAQNCLLSERCSVKDGLFCTDSILAFDSEKKTIGSHSALNDCSRDLRRIHSSGVKL